MYTSFAMVTTGRRVAPNTERVPIGVNEGMHSFDMHWASWTIDIYV